LSANQDWLVVRRWGKPLDELEICLLTTRGSVLSRHIKQDIRRNLKNRGYAGYIKIPGLRRYKTQAGADRKAHILNIRFNTNGYSSIREDAI
jgi:hypothetical protein